MAATDTSTGYVRNHLRLNLPGGADGLYVWTSPGRNGFVTTVRRSDNQPRWDSRRAQQVADQLADLPGAQVQQVPRTDRLIVTWDGA